MNPLLSNEPTTVSAFPAPPMCFISQYTDEAVENGTAPKPPPLPAWPQFSAFGQEYSVSSSEPIISSLESQGIPRLHPVDFDHREELKKMNHSILLNFLDLIDILIRNPGHDAAREQKLDNLNNLFVHMMHLVNEFRPHQARETVRVMLKSQLKQRSEICLRLQEFYDKLEQQFSHYLEVLPEHIRTQAKIVKPEMERASVVKVETTNEPIREGRVAMSNGSHCNEVTSESDQNVAVTLDTVVA